MPIETKGIGGFDVPRENIYYVYNDAELDEAIADIESNNYMGYIHILADLLNVEAVINDALAGFIIDLHGHTLESDVSQGIISVSNCKSFIMKNGVLDYSDGSNPLGNIIGVPNASNTPVYFEKLRITGDGVNGIVNITANNVSFIDCEIDNINSAAYIGGASECTFFNCRIHDCLIGGILIVSGAHNNLVAFCNVKDVDPNSDDNPAYGIAMYLDSDQNRIIGNYINNIQNSGSNLGLGIAIYDATCDDNVIDSNVSKNCKTANLSDSGTNTVLGDNSV